MEPKEMDESAEQEQSVIPKKKIRNFPVRVDERVYAYFKELSLETGIPRLNLVEMCLIDCAINKRKPSVNWDT